MRRLKSARFAQSRPAMTLLEVLAVVAVISAILAALLPAILRAQENARKLTCIDKLKQIGMALDNYEDKRKAFPPISTNFDPTSDIPGDPSPTTDAAHQAPGSAPSSGAGYSWIVMILPEIEEA